jgi:hypothetical protein
MRIIVSDLARLKQAAKYLVRESSDLKLSTAQESLASALGYRDWHELSDASKADTTPTRSRANIDDALQILASVSESSGVSLVDVQYALCKARVIRNTPWSIEEQLKLCSGLWRQQLFGPPRRGKPGTIVKDKAFGAGTPAYLLRAGRPTYLLFDTGLGTRADFEVATPRRPQTDFVPSRLWLPYGYWTLRDGSEVVFSRDYFPLWRIAAGSVERLDPWLWIKEIVEEFHFAESLATAVWASGAARNLALQFLIQRRVFELPKLLNAMPYLFDVKVESMGDAVRCLGDLRDKERAFPHYAGLSDRPWRYR